MIGFILLSVFLTLVILALLLSLSIRMSKLTLTLPSNDPIRWIEQNGNPTDKPPRQNPVIVCAGDSITHGIISTNWVGMLESRFPDCRFINAGVNSELAYNLLGRIDPIIGINPDIVIILIGTNDVNAKIGRASCRERV